MHVSRKRTALYHPPFSLLEAAVLEFSLEEKMSKADLACKVYVGDLPTGTTEKDLEKEFGYYGK